MPESAAAPAATTPSTPPSPAAGKSATPATKGESTKSAGESDGTESETPDDVSEPAATREDEAGGEGPDAEPAEGEEEGAEALSDEHGVDVDGDEVPLRELKKAYKARGDLRKLHAETEKVRTLAQKVLKGIGSDDYEQSKGTLLDIFTAMAGNDRDRGYAMMIQRLHAILKEHVDEENLSPAERELKREKRQRTEAERKLQVREEAERAATEKAKLERDTAQVEQLISSAMTRNGLPDNAKAFHRVRRAMIESFDEGAPIDEDEACLQVRREFYTTDIDESVDIEKIPAAVIEKIRKRDLEKVRPGRTAALSKPVGDGNGAATLWQPPKLGVL